MPALPPVPLNLLELFLLYALIILNKVSLAFFLVLFNFFAKNSIFCFFCYVLFFIHFFSWQSLESQGVNSIFLKIFMIAFFIGFVLKFDYATK